MKNKFTKISLFISFAICCLSINANAQDTYYWAGGNTGTLAWNAAGNWSTTLGGGGTTRTVPNAGDILIFDGSDLGSAVTGALTVNTLVTETLAQLKFINGANVTLGHTASRNITIAGSTGDDFIIETGAIVVFGFTANISAITITFNSGTTGNVAGTLTLQLGTHKLTPAAEAACLTFESGAVFNHNPSSGSAFSLATAIATNNNTVFKSGSDYHNYGGSNPFVLTGPASVTEFQSGSNFIINSITGLSTPNRVFGNLIVAVDATLSPAFAVDNLTVNSGVTATFSSSTNRISVKGSINVLGTIANSASFPDLLMIGTGSLQTIFFNRNDLNFRSFSVGTDAIVELQNDFNINISSPQQNNYGVLDMKDKVITAATAGLGSFVNRAASTVSASLTSSLSANSITFVSTSASGISNGMLVTSSVHPPNTYIVNTSGGTFTTSKRSTGALSIGEIVTVSNGTAHLKTSNSGGFNSGLASFAAIDLKGDLTFNAATTTPFPTIGSLAPESVTINENVTLNRQTNITELLTVAAAKTLTTGGMLTLKSNATQTARVVTSASSVISGDVTVERYISNIGRKWRLLSTQSTTSSQTIFDSWQEGGAAVNNLGTWVTAPTGVGFDATSVSSSILRHNQIIPSWLAPVATNTGTINDDQGYMLFVRGDRNDNPGNATNAPTVLRTRGALRIGTQPAVVVSATGSGRTLVGNPYASPIDMETIFTGTANLDQSMYVWDPSLNGNFGVGGYRNVVRTAGGTYDQTPVVLTGTVNNDPTIQFIHSGQAVFLKASTANANVVFTESMKAVAPTTVYNPIVATPGDQQIIANLMVVNAGTASLADGIRVRYDAAYQSSTADDIEKMGNFGENISSYREGKKLIVEQRPMIASKDTIFLRMTNLAVKDYRFQIGTVDFVQSNVTAFLQDTYLSSVTGIDLTGNINDINFSVTTDPASADQDRFRIIFAAAGPLPVSFTSVKAAQQAGNIAVEWKVSNQVNIKQYELEKSTNGSAFEKVNTQSVIGASGSDATYNWLDTKPVVGDNFYRVRSIGNGGEEKLSQLVNVKIAKGNPAVTVYPNPVVNRTVSVQFTDMEKGIYQLRIVSTTGQVVFTQTINHSGGSAVQTVKPGETISAGNYIMDIIKPDNSHIRKGITIVN